MAVERPDLPRESVQEELKAAWIVSPSGDRVRTEWFQGKAVVMISSDTPELVAVSDRVGVMRNGSLATILEGKRITEENVLRFALGVDEEEEKEGK